MKKIIHILSHTCRHEVYYKKTQTKCMILSRGYAKSLFFILVLLAGVCTTIQAQTWKTTAASTDWFTTTNWSTNAVPTATTDVIIPVGATNYPVISSGTANAKSITFSTGAGSQPSLTVSGGTLTDANAFTVNAGSVTFSGGTVTLKDFTVATGLTVTQSGGNLLKISHDWKNSGTFNSTSGTVEYTGNATAATDYSLGSNQFNNIIIDATVKPLFDNTTCTINVSGNFTNNNTTQNLAAAAGFSFNGTGNQSISSAATGTNATFGTLVINNTGGTVSLSNNVVVAGNATVTNGIFDLSTFTCNRKTAGGTFTVSAGATLRLAGAFPASFTTGTFASTSTVEYYGTAAQTVAAFNYGNLTTSGARATNSITYASGTVGVSNTFSPNATFTSGANIITGNTINFNGSIAQTIPAFAYNNLTSSSTGTRTLDNSANIKIAATFTPGTNTYTVTGSTVEFNGSAVSTIPVLTVSSGANYNNLTFSGTSTSFAFGGAMTIGGDLTISSGTVDMNNTASARTITLSGNFNQSGGTLDLGSGAGLTTVNISGNITQTAGTTTTVGSPTSNNIFSFTGQDLQTITLSTPANYIFVNYVVGSGDSLQLGSNVNLTTYTSATYAGTMTINSGGTIIFPAAYSITPIGTSASHPVFTLNSGAKMNTANASGVDGSVPSTNMTRTYNAGANYEFNGSTGQNAGLVNTTVNNITASVSGTLNLNTDAAVGGTLTVNSGCTFTPGASNVISGAGTLTGSGTAQVTRTTATADFNTQYSITTKTLTNLTIDYTATAAQTINALNYSNLTTSGARTSNSITFASSGTVGITGTFNPSATFSSGGYIMTGSTVDFNGSGAQNIPAFTFNNLNTSGSGTTKTASGALVVNATLTLNTNVTLDMAGNALSGTLSSVAGTGTLKTQNTTSTPIPTGKTWTGTVEYNKTSGAQTIVTGTYNNLTNSNTSGTNSAGGALTVNGTLTLNSSCILDMVTFALSGSLTSISGTGTIKTQNTSSTPLPSGKTWTGDVYYNSSSAQTIVSGNYTNLNGTGGNRTLSSGTTGIAGTFTVGSGTYTTTGSTVDFNGSGAQNIPAFSFEGLNVSGGNTKTVNGSVSVSGALTLAASTTLALGSNNITLISNSSGTARIAAVPTTASITYGTGTFIVQRYIQGRRKYRLMASPVTTYSGSSLSAGQEALSIWGNWQNQGNNSTANTGTIITGGASGDGYDQQTTNASLFTYDGVNRKYVGYTTANSKTTKYTPLKAGVCYYMFVYGDRLNSVSTSTPNYTVLSETGTIVTGDQTYNTSSTFPLTNTVGNYTMLGNPFASPIDWASVTKTNLYSTFWGWDPNLSSTGGYVTVNTTGTVTLISPFTGTTGIDQYIQSGQGFFVRTSATSPVLVIKESDKVSNNNTNAFRTSAPNSIPLIAINLYEDNTLLDGALAAFSGSFSNAVGKEDAEKIFNAAEGVSIENGSDLLSIDARNMPVLNDTISLHMLKLTKPQYTLRIFTNAMDIAGAQPYLYDGYLKTTAALSVTDTNRITFNVTSDAASSDADRFKIIFDKPGLQPVIANSVTSQLKVFPNPVIDERIHFQFNDLEKGTYAVILVNSQGQQILSRSIDHPGGGLDQTISTGKKLPNGIYYLSISNKSTHYNKTIFIQ